METLSESLNICNLLLSVLMKEKRFVDKQFLKIQINKSINNSKYKNNLEQDMVNDKLELLFDDCIKVLLKYSLIDHKITDGEILIKINKIGEKIYEFLYLEGSK